MMSLWDALRMNMMISYQELVRTFLKDMIGINAAKDDEITCGFHIRGSTSKCATG